MEKAASPTLAVLNCLLASLLFCSCATRDQAPPRPVPPAETAMNDGAGRGDWLIAKVLLPDGEELPFMVDTGTPITLFDQSLEARLGKRLGSTTFWNFNVKSRIGIYAAPDLYLGNTPLVTGRRVYATDFRKLSRDSGRRVLGILGMDCLAHYTIQLDFEAGKIRFLDSDHLNPEALGHAFPLTLKDGHPFIRHAGFVEKKEINLMIDTGCMFDALAKASHFPGSLRDQRGETLPTCLWNGDTYTNVVVKKEQPDVIGLRFLARHLMTLDFPNRTMYLKQTSVGPLVDNDLEEATNFLKDLKENGQVPGWAGTDRGTINLVGPTFFGTFEFVACKEGDSSIYHYTVAWISREAGWKLQRAARADRNDRIVEEYPLP